jgi:poly-beta-1,6-N-acetyl-D-glucosamine synthase
MKSNYVIVTAVRDEIESIQLTLDSVVCQTILPKLWVVVDDDSTDGTSELLEGCANEHSWIKVLHRLPRSGRAVGKNVVDIINEGWEQIQGVDWDFWVKLDADISFDSRYFEDLMQRFDENPRLGMASGKAYNPTVGGGYKLEWNPDHNVLGMARMYRRECWEDIGTLAPRRLWDVIDVYTAQMHGWETRSFNDLSVVHLRPIDTRQKGQLARRFDLGHNHYTMGYHPLYFLFRCLRAIWDEKPYLIAGIMMYLGFIYAWINRETIYNQQLKDFIRQRQLRFLNLHSLYSYLSRRGQSSP